MNRQFDVIIDGIIEKDSRYKADAYELVMEALSFTQKKFRRVKHVTGEELLAGIRELLMEKFGPMTLSVLKHWGIKSTEDFGNIVFNLVENKVLSKTEEDTIESFRNGFDLHDTFQEGYKRRLEKRLSRMRSI
ncbi:MAG TPA: hypothetical protein PL155_09395 [Candidatus Omnitrophota bacterium]|nr:hypothetical protein [Candidatus Omnitrophota bacterium]HPD85610.1 hypothetical protein [Candidatus Omnitrophota bacterium]HRZ04453.1 hypothetical protein [Candidatus Omnitrophota bacterium]